MNSRKILDEFLALRRASESGEPAEREPREPGKARSQESQQFTRQSVADHSAEASHPAAETPVTESKLAACVGELLAAHPGARPVKDRLGLANYVARGIIHRFGEPRQIVWETEASLRGRKVDGPLVAQCPAGHMTAEMIDCHQVVGWACATCRRVYDATECRVVPRQSASEDTPGRT